MGSHIMEGFKIIFGSKDLILTSLRRLLPAVVRTWHRHLDSCYYQEYGNVIGGGRVQY